jgi:branched-chain amino acid transport system substrate-binding protein
MTAIPKTLIAAAVFAVTLPAAHADVTVGAVLPLTGPGSGAGIPMHNMIKLWPKEIAGEKLKVIVLDDASDPSKGVQAARRLVSEEKVDLLISSVVSPVAVAMVEVSNESETPTLAGSPIVVAAGRDAWTFRLPQSATVMSMAMINLMRKQGVKTVGFLGYTDAYGEQWLKDFSPLADKAGMKVTAVERFARSDTSVMAQALKLTSANPDAILIVASGSGAAMPHKAIAERGYKGRIYQTHAAASPDLMRLGGKDVEGGFVVSGPAVVPELLPASNPSKAPAMDFVTKYEGAYGKGSRSTFAANMYDALTVLNRTLPVALKKAKPGSRDFRVAVRDAIETMGPVHFAHGEMVWSKDNHWGYTPATGVMLKVVNGGWAYQD